MSSTCEGGWVFIGGWRVKFEFFIFFFKKIGAQTITKRLVKTVSFEFKQIADAPLIGC
jgi:hypothetical protein